MKKADFERQQAHLWFKTREKWREQVLAEGFGRREERLALLAMETFVPPSKRKRFRKFVDNTGAGDNPAYVRFMIAVGEYLDQGMAGKERPRGKKRSHCPSVG